MYLAAYRRTEAGVYQRTAAQRMEAHRIRMEERMRQEQILAEKLAEAERQRQEKLAARAAGPFKHTFREIERRACKLFRVTPSELRSGRRHKEIVFARQFVMYWATRLTPLSLPAIGRLMGGRDHTTCLSGKRAYVHKRKFFHKRHLREAR